METVAPKRIEDEMTNGTIHPERTSGGRKRQTTRWALSAMISYKDTTENKTNGGGRARWPPYTPQERTTLGNKFLGNWKRLDFLQTIWNPIYDRRDLFQYRRTAEVWKMRLSGRTFKEISRKLEIDQRKACALVSGKNLHPYLVQMYLNSQML